MSDPLTESSTPYRPQRGRGHAAEADEAIDRVIRQFIFVRDQDEFYCRLTRRLVPLDAVRNAHAHEMPLGPNGRRLNAAKLILESAEATKVESVTFEPGGPEIVTAGSVRRINLWRPPPITPVPGDASWFIEHVSYLCGGDEIAVRAICDFAACLVQTPGRKLRWSPLIVGRQGIGKNLLADAIMAVIGPEYVVPLSDTDVRSQFNDWLAQAQLVVVSELMSGERAEVMNRLKPYITDSTITINKKYARPYSITNRTNFLLFSNHEDAAIIEDGDRRYLVHISRAMPRDPEYYAVIARRLKADAPVLLNFLLERDLSEFNPDAPAPMSEGKARMAALSRTNLEAYLEDAFEAGDPPLDKDLVVINRVLHWLNEKRIHGASHKSISKFLGRIGAVPLRGVKRLTGASAHVWAIRDHDRWQAASESEIRVHLERPAAIRPPMPGA